MVRAALMHPAAALSGILLATIACGPPSLGGGTDGEEQTTSGDSTESSTESSEDETGDMSTTGTFVPPPDVPANECDPFAQDCPEGEKCVPYASSGGYWDANKCVEVLGDQAVGEPCHYAGAVAATDDCDATSYCWNVMDVGGEALGTMALCTGTADVPVCPPNSSCTVSGSGDINLCIPHCDPFEQDCADGLGCYWTDGDFNCVFTSQDIPAGQPCGYVNDCAAGLVCLVSEVLPGCDGSACCTGFCNLELGDAPCEALLPGTVCSAFFEENAVPPGYELVGVCILPEP